MLDGRGGVKPLENTDVIDERIPAGSTLIMYTMIAPNGWDNTAASQ